MRNVPLRTASLCVAFLLLGRAPALAQTVVPTPQEEERAREALRAGLDNKSPDDRPDEPSPFDPHSAKTWEVPPADIAPGLHAHLFQPSTEILTVTPDSDWLPGMGMPQPEEAPQEDRAATASLPDREPEPPAELATSPAPQQKSGKSRTVVKKVHSTLRSGRASLDENSAPAKKPRRKTERPAPKAPAVVLPGELQP